MVTPSIEMILRSLALQDETVISDLLAMDVARPDGGWLEQRTQGLVRLAALVALDAPVVSYQSAVLEALAAGAAAEEIVGAVVAIAPLVGIARVTAAVPALGLALGYDLDAAFERLDEQDLPRGAAATTPPPGKRRS